MQLTGMMRGLRVAPAMLAMAATMSLTACVVDLGPEGAHGFYDLRSANGGRVPAVVFSRSGNDGYRVTLLRGELRLRDDNTFRLDLDYLEEGQQADTRYTQGVTGEWSVEDGTIWLDYVDPDSGDWQSLAASRRHNELEVNIPGAVNGATIRAVFER